MGTGCQDTRAQALTSTGKQLRGTSNTDAHGVPRWPQTTGTLCARPSHGEGRGPTVWLLPVCARLCL